MWSRGLRSSTTRAATRRTRCNGARVDDERPASITLQDQRIFTVDSLKDADLRKDVPFRGLDDE